MHSALQRLRFLAAVVCTLAVHAPAPAPLEVGPPPLAPPASDPPLGTALVPGDYVASPGGWSYRLREQVRSCSATYAAPHVSPSGADRTDLALDIGDTMCYVGSPSSWSHAEVSRRSPDPDAPTVLSASALDERTQRRRRYNLGGRLGRGAQGEVWRALRIGPNGEEEAEDAGDAAAGGGGGYILKRMFAGRPGALLSGWREAWFGASLRSQPYVARYVEHFLRSPPGAPPGGAAELWLVFRDEGVSLQSLLYSARRLEGAAAGSSGDAGPSAAALLPSPFWLRLATEPEGAAVFAALLRQLLHAARDLRRVGVLHRDIKPANVLLAARGGALRLRLADFGSAVDDDALTKLYPVRWWGARRAGPPPPSCSASRSA